jgi:hypothetical protein
MTTSGTTSFDLNIDDIIEEAYERCGVRTNSGWNIKSARRSLNLLFSEWGNRGLHLWKVVLQVTPMVSGQPTYTTPSNCSDVLEAYISSTSDVELTTRDLTLSKIDRSTYASLPNKGQIGQPSQYYIDRQINPTINLYLCPNNSIYQYVKYYYIARIQDAGDYTNTTDLPYRFLPCMVSGLAFYLSQKVAPERIQNLKLLYEDELQRALEEDSQRTSVFISPYTYFGRGV